MDDWLTCAAEVRRSSGGGAPVTVIESLGCMPIWPLDAETRARLGIQTPITLFQTVICTDQVRAGDLFIPSSGEVFQVRAVERWDWSVECDEPFWVLVLEKAKR